VWKPGLRTSEKTRLGDQCGKWAWGLVWKPGFGANVETAPGASVETSVRVYWSFI